MKQSRSIAGALLTALVLPIAAFSQTRPTLMAPPAAGLPAYPAIVRDDPPNVINARMQWFREARFGLFIHWGVYAAAAGSWQGKPVTAEWIMNRAKISVADYKALAQKFTADKYDPRAWAALARESGFKYVVITAKHHEGFALWDSQVSDWNAVKASGAHRDLIAPLADAVRAEGLKFGCYYSQSQDWVNPGGSKGATSDLDWDPAQKGSFDEYLKNTSLPQVKEIFAKFHPDIIWWDTEYQMTPERAEPFFELVMRHPDTIQNSRLGGGVLGDFRTSEQKIPASALIGRQLEVNMTINDSWGYNANDTHWKSSQQLIQNLSNVASLGGNYLLNVGPTAEGEIPAPEVERLQAIGKWLKTNGQAIYGTQASPFASVPDWGRATEKTNADGTVTLFLHIWKWPADGKIEIPEFVDTLVKLPVLPNSVHLLASAAKVNSRIVGNSMQLSLPGTAPDPDVSVVSLEFLAPVEPGVANPMTQPSGKGQ
jgi:alpha-L-fucosidase